MHQDDTRSTQRLAINCYDEDFAAEGKSAAKPVVSSAKAGKANTKQQTSSNAQPEVAELFAKAQLQVAVTLLHGDTLHSKHIQ